MDSVTLRIYQRVVSSMFNDGVVNLGRILTLFVFTRQVCEQFPDQARVIWETYHEAVRGTGYEDIGYRSTNQIDGF